MKTEYTYKLSTRSAVNGKKWCIPDGWAEVSGLAELTSIGDSITLHVSPTTRPFDARQPRIFNVIARNIVLQRDLVKPGSSEVIGEFGPIHTQEVTLTIEEDVA